MSDKRGLKFSAEETWLEVVDDLKSMIDKRKAAMEQALTLGNMLNIQLLVVKKIANSEVIEAMSTPVLHEVSKLLNGVCVPWLGTILEQIVEMVHIAHSRVNEATGMYKKLQTSISKATKMYRDHKLVDFSMEDIKELAKNRVRQITVLLNSVSVEKDGK